MIKTEAIKLANDRVEPMMVTWDTGRRCNLDCTYCESTRHNNYSSFHSLNEYIKTFEFIVDWSNLYNSFRDPKPDFTNINFTGGEPTLNPNFWNLLEHIYCHDSNFNLSLTTNGAWNPKFNKKIKKYMFGVTVSYHTEANSHLKDIIIKNILDLNQSSIWLQVNLMLHHENWEECKRVYELLTSKGVKVNPRPIGDGNEEQTGWFFDSEGVLRKTAHEYTEEQKEWYFYTVEGKNFKTECVKGDDLGRSCCGGRCIKGKVDDHWKDVKLVDTHFKGWACSVDWYFLHVEQHTGEVFHHQTCQAKHGNKRGPIGNIGNSDKLLNDLYKRLHNYSDPIICPNTRCGCGMCVPKAKSLDVFRKLEEEFKTST